MAYSTVDMIKRLISEETLLQLCDDDNVGAIVEDPPNTAYNNVATAISQADNTIDSYIAGKYDLPLSSTPLSVADASANLAICNLFDRRREMDVPAGVDRRRKAVMKWLADIQDGKAHIPELVSDRSTVAQSSKTADDQIWPDSVLGQM